jgi:cysteinyl-tRNA synthetase
VHDFPSYGKLSGKSLDDLRAGERVDIDVNKKDPLDFVLWKAAKPGEPFWDSPWGRGRPGWHIECSAMSEQLLGWQFDIHGGGQDLQFPHHENEIAQSEGAHDHPFVNYWMHNGFVRVDNEKMSKSLGNFFTVREILKHYQPEVVRFFILRAHYRSPLNYSDQHLKDTKLALDRLYISLKEVDSVDTANINWESGPAQKFKAAMNDDFNTPEAIAVLFELASDINKTGSRTNASLLKALGGLLGLLQQNPQDYLQNKIATNDSDTLTQDAIESLIQQRITARKEGRYSDADAIRKGLLDKGILLEDSSQGTTWRRQ